MSEFKLLPLNCPSCGSALSAECTDTIFYCVSCRNGYSVSPEGRDLRPLEVSFVSSVGKVADLYLPFWLLPTGIVFHERRSNSSRSLTGLVNFFTGNEAGAAGGERFFAIPAFQGPLQSIVNLSTAYTERFPDLDQLLGEQLIGGLYDSEDAKKLAHCILVGNEINISDTLLSLRYDLEFGEPELLGVPFIHSNEGLKDAIFSITIELPSFLRSAV